MLRMGSSQLAVLDWNPGLPILEASTLSLGVKKGESLAYGVEGGNFEK